jgi:hypothetical protein
VSPHLTPAACYLTWPPLKKTAVPLSSPKNETPGSELAALCVVFVSVFSFFLLYSCFGSSFHCVFSLAFFFSFLFFSFPSFRACVVRVYVWGIYMLGKEREPSVVGVERDTSTQKLEKMVSNNRGFNATERETETTSGA